MKKRTVFLAACTLFALMLGARPARAVVCYYDGLADGTGKAMRWSQLPVKYYINDTLVPEANKATWEKAVQDAFIAYEIACTEFGTSKFQYMGKSTSSGYVTGAILVEWGTTASMGNSAYIHFNKGTPLSEGMDIEYSFIRMNIDYYSIGKIIDKIDIQTAVMQLIPVTLGFWAANGQPPYIDSSTKRPAGGQATDIKYDYENHALTDEQKKSLLFFYFKDDGTGCVKPTDINQACFNLPSPDHSIKEAGPSTLDKGTVLNPDKGTITHPDSGTTTPGGDDKSGCCRISHATSPDSSDYLALLGIAFFLALRRRRR